MYPGIEVVERTLCWERDAVSKRIREELEKPEFLITCVEDRPGHGRRYAMDCSKILREWGR
jgi:dTDP-D-glucose 4,6-dehydratase